MSKITMIIPSTTAPATLSTSASSFSGGCPVPAPGSGGWVGCWEDSGAAMCFGAFRLGVKIVTGDNRLERVGQGLADLDGERRHEGAHRLTLRLRIFVGHGHTSGT